MKKAILFIFLIFFSNNIFAVDGFYDLKFGMSVEQVLKLNYCSFKFDDKIDNSDGSWDTFVTDFNRLKFYDCEDFKSGNWTFSLLLTFIDNKLKRVILRVNKNKVFNQVLVKELKKKYGYRNADGAVKYSSQLYIFDDKTVEAEVYDDNSMYVRYISPDFDKILLEEPGGKKLIDSF